MYNWFHKLEFGMLNLPKPDIKVLLFMPREFAHVLNQKRAEPADELERDEDHLILAQNAYLEMSKLEKIQNY